MLRSYLSLSLLTLSLYASLVQTAPSPKAVMAIYRIDPLDLPANAIVSRDYAFADKRTLDRNMELPSLQNNFEQNDGNAMQMHLLQLNLLKILIILDVIIFICLFYSVK